jgi:hypothetical protein
LDTLTLAPASALTRKAAWQAAAYRVPPGSVLIVTSATWAGEPLAKIVQAFQRQHRTVVTLTLEHLTEHQASLL